MIFDVLHIEGTSLLNLTYRDRRARLESLGLVGAAWSTPSTFDDGKALYKAVCERGLRASWRSRTDPLYRAGKRGWVKVKNPAYWRRESELGAMKKFLRVAL